MTVEERNQEQYYQYIVIYIYFLRSRFKNGKISTEGENVKYGSRAQSVSKLKN